MVGRGRENREITYGSPLHFSLYHPRENTAFQIKIPVIFLRFVAASNVKPESGAGLLDIESWEI